MNICMLPTPLTGHYQSHKYGGNVQTRILNKLNIPLGQKDSNIMNKRRYP